MKIITLPPSYNRIPDSMSNLCSVKELSGRGGCSSIDGGGLEWREMFKQTVINDVPRGRTNSTVVMGAVSSCVAPVATEVTSDSETEARCMAGISNVAVRADVIWAIFSIVTIAMTLKANGIRSSKRDVQLVRSW